MSSDIFLNIPLLLIIDYTVLSLKQSGGASTGAVLSHKYKFIFMHVPKCAGETVEQYFVRLGVPDYDRSWRLPPLRKQCLAKAVNLFPDYFTFAFVRNPFDRFVSYYFHGLRLRQDANRRLSYKNMHECIELAAELLAVNETDLKAAKFGPRQVEGSALEVYEWYHAKRQTEFLLDCNPASYFGVRRFNDDSCSFIGRQESFDKDFACLLNILGIEGGRQLPTESRNVSPQRMIDGQRRHYSYYYDKTSRRMIEELYARDLEFLGYEFEEDGVVSVLNPLYDLQAARRKRGERLPLRQWVTVSPRRVAWKISTVWRKFIRSGEKMRRAAGYAKRKCRSFLLRTWG